MGSAKQIDISWLTRLREIICRTENSESIGILCIKAIFGQV